MSVEKWTVVELYFVRLTKLEWPFPGIPSLYIFKLRSCWRQCAWGLRLGRWGSIYSFLCLQGQSGGSKCCCHSRTLPFLFWLIILAGNAAKPIATSVPSGSSISFFEPCTCPYLARALPSPAGHCIIKMGSLEAVKETWVLVSLCGSWFVSVLPRFISIFPT